jgi:hypothetical protein
MGTVIRFPFERRDIWSDVYHEEPALVLILPVIRVERLLGDAPRDRCLEAFAALREAMDTVGGQP